MNAASPARLRGSGIFLVCLFACLGALAADPVEIKIGVLPGLKYDVQRFAVAPGAAVTLQLRNPDQMIHNLVIVQPGARMEIVMAALALGADGPAKNFVPDSPKVLFHTRALNPGETQELKFDAPKEEGVYPYVCTFTGHGLIMYGAMYVTTKPLPPLEGDPNLPPAAAAIDDAADHSHHALTKPVLSRTFLPDCGPAAIAVGFPGGQSFCFDAGLCMVRYAWSGGFVDNTEHWSGKGETMGKIVGRIYYRVPATSPLIIGNNDAPAMRWKGYEMRDGVPQFHFTADGHPVSLTVRPSTGREGLEYTYEIESGGLPVIFNPGPGGVFEPAGETVARGVRYTAEAARHITIFIGDSRSEPFHYWSMNDLPFPQKRDPEAGVLGRAFTPGGVDGKRVKLDTGTRLGDLTKGGTLEARTKGDAVIINKPAGGTLIAWFKLAIDPKKSAWNYPLFGVGEKALYAIPHTTSTGWEHVAITFSDRTGNVYRNGDLVAREAPTFNEAALGETITIGSAGNTFLKGLIDEVRMYDRVLSSEEIKAIFGREAANLPEADRPRAIEAGHRQ